MPQLEPVSLHALQGTVQEALEVGGSPCFVISELSIRQALARLQTLETSVRVRHLFSMKTQPVRRVAETAAELGMGVDVVSGFELHAALAVGFDARDIVVNGAGKSSWLMDCRVPDLVVHFDSLAEVRALVATAVELRWRVAIRCAVPELMGDSGRDPSPLWDQFGMTGDEVMVAADILHTHGLRVAGLHFHLHRSTRRVAHYVVAVKETARIAMAAGIEPDYLDIGGGLPIPGEWDLDGNAIDANFDMNEFLALINDVPRRLPSVREVWLENGRYLTGPSGALVVTVLDRKVRGDQVFLICDGGRVNHARMAASEVHQLVALPQRSGRLRETQVCGPTCGAVDRLGCWMMPDTIVPGDRLVWLTAGAYHIPLETRFSSGHAPVVWINSRGEAEVLRQRETPSEWWGQWTAHRPLRQPERAGQSSMAGVTNTT